MKTGTRDPEYINDNLPIERQITIMHRWAKQMGHQLAADTFQRSLDELEELRK